MDDGGSNGVFDVLWRGKYYIVLALVLMVTVTVAAYFIFDARDLASRLSQKESDYGTLNDKYDKLSSDHTALVASNDDLNRRYTDLDGKYNSLDDKYNDLDGKYNQLSTDNQKLNSSYNDLIGNINRMHETGGPSIAMRYSFYEAGPSNNRKKYLEVWVYNVGDSKEDRVTVKGRIVNADNTTSDSSQAFDNVEALDKRYVKWEYSSAVQLNSVWYET